jgi:hypothetical protein
MVWLNPCLCAFLLQTGVVNDICNEAFGLLILSAGPNFSINSDNVLNISVEKPLVRLGGSHFATSAMSEGSVLDLELFHLMS